MNEEEIYADIAEKVFLEILEEAGTTAYEKFCTGEISAEEFETIDELLMRWSEDTEKVLSALIRE